MPNLIQQPLSPAAEFPEPSALDIAEQPDPQDIWPRDPIAGGFRYLALVWVALILIGAIMRYTRATMPVVATVGAGVLVFLLAALAFVIVRAVRRRRRRASGLRPSNGHARVRLIGASSSTDRIAAATVPGAFEPVILRSLRAVSYAKMKDGRPVSSARRRRRRHAATHTPRRGVAWLSFALSVLASAGTILALQYVAFGSFFPFTAFHVFAMLIGIVLFDAFLMPVYIRIAPGVLDVLRFPILGAGRAVSERYDLRTARVCVDLDMRYARIDDLTRPSHPVLFLHLPSLLGGHGTTAADILRGALTTSPTPPLPDDALLG